MNESKISISQGPFWHIRVGDTVTRLLAGVVKMKLEVTQVDERLIHVCDPETGVDGWTFDRSTGFEEDPELGWGASFGMTGSQLIKETE
jgi:hypothetical protein